MAYTRQLNGTDAAAAAQSKVMASAPLTRERWCSALLLLSVTAFCSSAVIAAPIYTVRDLGSLGGSYGIPVSVNNGGQVVGDALTAGDVAVRATLFGASGGSNIDLGTLGGNVSYSKGINNSGQVVGYALTTTTNVYRATLFGTSGGTNADLGTLGGSSSVATGINDSGQVVGYADLSNSLYHAALFSTSGGANIDLGTLGSGRSVATGINGGGQVVGYSEGLFPGLHATLFSTSGGANVDLGTLGGTTSVANAINEAGQVVGTATTTGDAFEHATLFSTSGGANIDLGTLGGTRSYANSINNNGQVVGYDAGGNDAFIWDGGVMTSLDALVDPASEWDFVYALDINDLGQIAVYGYDRNTGALHGLLLSPHVANSVPAPASILLVAMGLLGAASARMRQRKISARRSIQIRFAR